MQTLSFCLLLYTIVGMWRPIEWSSKCSKSLLYSMYTFFALYLLTYLMVTHVLYAVFVADNVDDLTSSSSVFLSLISVWIKAIVVATRRDRIISLLKILQEEPCKARDEEEIDIQIKYERSIRSCSMPYLILCTFSCICSLTGGVLIMLDGQIPYGFVWVPWDCTSLLIFYLTSLQEIVGVFIGLNVNVATEIMFLAFGLQVCARLEILKHRLQKMLKRRPVEMEKGTSPLSNASNKTSRLSEHVSHHLCIIRLAKMINDVFSQVFFTQFFTSALLLCTLVYYLAFHMTVRNMATFTCYAVCMFLQIFLYCLAGNEVTLKSAALGEEIFHMDWILTTTSEQKDLLMIMKRSTRPIKFTSSFLVTLSLESYGNILKASFSTFNLLQQL